MSAAHTEVGVPAFRVVFEKEGSGPAAARVESARKTMERCIVMVDEGLGNVIVNEWMC